MGSRFKSTIKRLYQSREEPTEEKIYPDDMLPDLKDIKIGKRIYSGKDLENIASEDYVGLFKKVFQKEYPITRTKSGLPKKPRNPTQTDNLVQRLKNKFTVLRFDILHNMKNKGDSITLRESIEHLEDIKQLINHFEEKNTTTFPYDLLETYIENSDIDLFSDDIDEEMNKSYIKQIENTRIKNLLRQFAKIYLQDEYKSNYDLYDPGMSKKKFEDYLEKSQHNKLIPVALGNLIRFLRDDYVSNKSDKDINYDELIEWIDTVHTEITNTSLPEETQEVILNGLLERLNELKNRPPTPEEPPATRTILPVLPPPGPPVLPTQSEPVNDEEEDLGLRGGAITSSNLLTKKSDIQDKIKELVGKYTTMKSKYTTDVTFTLGKIADCEARVLKCNNALQDALQKQTAATAAASTATSALKVAEKKLNELKEKIKGIKQRFSLGTDGIDDSTEVNLLESSLKSLECEIEALKQARDAAKASLDAANAEKEAALAAQATLRAEATAEKERRDLAEDELVLAASKNLAAALARALEAEGRLAALQASPTNQGTSTSELEEARRELAAARAEAEAAKAEADAAKEEAELKIEIAKAEAEAKQEDADRILGEGIASAKADAERKIREAKAAAQEELNAARAAAQQELSTARAAAAAAAQQGIAEANAAAEARIAAAEARVSEIEDQAAAAAAAAEEAAAAAARNNAQALEAAAAASAAALSDLQAAQDRALRDLQAAHLAELEAKQAQINGYSTEIGTITREFTDQSTKKTEQITLLLSVLENTKNMALENTEDSITSIYNTLMGTIGSLSMFDDQSQKTTITQHIEVIKQKLIDLINGKQTIERDAARAAEAAAAAARAAAQKAATDASLIRDLQGEASAAAIAAQAKAREAEAAAAAAEQLRAQLANSASELSGATVKIRELEEQIRNLLSSQTRANNPTVPAVPAVPRTNPVQPATIYNQSSQQGQPVQQSSSIEEFIINIFKDREVNSYLSGYKSNTTTLSNLLKRLYQIGLFTAEIRAMITVKSITKNDDYDKLTLFIDGTDNMVNTFINKYVNKQTVGNKAQLQFLLSNDPTARTNPYYKYELLPTVLINQLEDENALKTLVEKMMTKLKSLNDKIKLLSSSRRAANPRVYSQRGGLHSMSLDIANDRYNNNLLEETNPFYSIIEKFDKSSNTNMIARANETIMMEKFLNTMLKDHFTDIEMKQFFLEASNILDKKSCDDISTLCFELLEICKLIEQSDKNIDVIKLENTSLNVDFDKLENKIKECPYDFFEQAKKHFPTKKEISIGFFKDAIYFYLETDKFDKTYTIDKQNELHLANFDFNEEIYYVNNHMLYLFFIICNKIITKQKFAELDSYIRKQKRSKTKRMSTLLKERKEIN